MESLCTHSIEGKGVVGWVRQRETVPFPAEPSQASGGVLETSKILRAISCKSYSSSTKPIQWPARQVLNIFLKNEGTYLYTLNEKKFTSPPVIANEHCSAIKLLWRVLKLNGNNVSFHDRIYQQIARSLTTGCHVACRSVQALKRVIVPPDGHILLNCQTLPSITA